MSCEPKTGVRRIGWAALACLAIALYLIAGLLVASASAPTASSTPVAVPAARWCVLDLDAPDIVIELEIGADVPDAQLELIEWVVDRRLHALGITACSLDRAERTLRIALQTGLTITQAECEALLTAPGRIELIDPAGDLLRTGDVVQTSGSRVTGAATPVGEPVHDVIVANAEIASIRPLLSEIGGPIAEFELTEEGHRNLSAYADANAGGVVPLVLDGVVIAAPVVLGPLPAVFHLQPIEIVATQRLAIYLAAPPYPAPLSVTGFADLRPAR